MNPPDLPGKSQLEDEQHGVDRGERLRVELHDVRAKKASAAQDVAILTKNESIACLALNFSSQVAGRNSFRRNGH